MNSDSKNDNGSINRQSPLLVNSSHAPSVDIRHCPHPKGHVSLFIRMMWGLGGIADNFLSNIITTLGLLIYVTGFKMDPLLAGLAISIPRFIDVFFDLGAGHLSDNARSRWGRRRPFMVWGLLGCVVLLPLLWTPPARALATAPWYMNIPFLYFTLLQVAYGLAYSMFAVPYTALGFELTPDYDDRTRILAWRMYFGLIAGMALPWLYRLTLLAPDEGTGAFRVSVGVAAAVLATGLMPVIFCRERDELRQPIAVDFRRSLRATASCRPFVILALATLIMIVGLFSSLNLIGFINIYHVCQGAPDPRRLAGEIIGQSGTVGAITSYLSMLLIARMSCRWSKRRGMNMGLLLALAGALAMGLALDPRWPRAQIWVGVITYLGLQGCWLMNDSMMADICDEDELATGARREGMFSAVRFLTMKTAWAINALLGGVLLRISGFSPNPAAEVIPVPPETAWRMKALILGVPAAAYLAAFLLFLAYPITRERAARTRRILGERQPRDQTLTGPLT